MPQTEKTFRRMKKIVAVGAASAMPFVVMSSAKADYDIISNSVEKLQEFYVFQAPETALTSGELFAEDIAETGIGVVVATEEQLGGKSPEEVVQLIQEKTPGVDSIILVVQGEQETIYSSSKDIHISEGLNSVLPSEPVDDAGWYLNDNSSEILYTYVEAGGTVSDAKKEQIIEAVENSTIAQMMNDGVSDHIFVADGAELSNEEQLSTTFQPGEIDVVVVSKDSTLLSAEDLSNIVVENSETKSVIVVVDGESKDEIAVAAHNDSLESDMSEVIGETVVDDAGTTLSNVRTELVAVEDSYLTTSQKFFAAGQVLGVILGVVLLGAGVIRGIRKVREIRKVKKEREMTYSRKLKEKYEEVNEGFLNSMVNLEELSVKHASLEKNNPELSLSSDIKELSRRLHDLLDVLEYNKISKGNQRELEIGYADKLNKLSELLSDKYYLDIVDNEEYWDKSSERVEQVRTILHNMTDNVVQNIRKVNKDHDLDIRVALSALEGLQHNRVEEVFEGRNLNESGSDKKTNNKREKGYYRFGAFFNKTA